MPHDGAVATVLGAMEIVNRQETITGAKLAETVRTVSACVSVFVFVWE